jgi:hypothetical protein
MMSCFIPKRNHLLFVRSLKNAIIIPVGLRKDGAVADCPQPDWMYLLDHGVVEGSLPRSPR